MTENHELSDINYPHLKPHGDGRPEGFAVIAGPGYAAIVAEYLNCFSDFHPTMNLPWVTTNHKPPVQYRMFFGDYQTLQRTAGILANVASGGGFTMFGQYVFIGGGEPAVSPGPLQARFSGSFGVMRHEWSHPQDYSWYTNNAKTPPDGSYVMSTGPTLFPFWQSIFRSLCDPTTGASWQATLADGSPNSAGFGGRYSSANQYEWYAEMMSGWAFGNPTDFSYGTATWTTGFSDPNYMDAQARTLRGYLNTLFGFDNLATQRPNGLHRFKNMNPLQCLPQSFLHFGLPLQGLPYPAASTVKWYLIDTTTGVETLLQTGGLYIRKRISDDLGITTNKNLYIAATASNSVKTDEIVVWQEIIVNTALSPSGGGASGEYWAYVAAPAQALSVIAGMAEKLSFPIGASATLGFFLDDPYGSIQTFKWQTSSDKATWTDVASSNTLALTVIVASGTLWYRLAVYGYIGSTGGQLLTYSQPHAVIGY